MRRLFCSLVILLGVLAFCPLLYAEKSILVLSITNEDDQPISDVLVDLKGDGGIGTVSDQRGKIRMQLARGIQSGDSVHLNVISKKWILLYPRDGRVIVPPFDKSSDNYVEVVLGKYGNKELLKKDKGLKTITENIVAQPKLAKNEISGEQRRIVLKEQAKAFGLDPDEVNEAIRAWAKKVSDPYEKGLTALYGENYSEATQQLSKSLDIQKGKREENQKKQAERDAAVVDTAFLLGQSLYEQGQYRKASEAYQEAATIRGDDALILNNLALSLHRAGDYAQAEPLYKRALAISEKALGPEHPDVAQSLNNLAALYATQGQYAQAEPLYKRALAIREKALGPEHPDVAISLNNLAGLYDTQGQYAQAEPLYKRALAISEKALGPDHPDVATSLNNLARLYATQGQYAQAEPLHKRALAISEKALGPEHPDVAISLNNLALLYKTQGQYAQAEPLYKRALAIFEKALGPEHPDVATSLNNLAGIYYTQGQYAQAEPLSKRALAISEKALGPEHPTVAASLNNLASLYATQGQYAQAEPLYKQALAIFEKALGPEHPDVAAILENLAALYEKIGDTAKQQAYKARAEKIRALPR